MLARGGVQVEGTTLPPGGRGGFALEDGARGMVVVEEEGYSEAGGTGADDGDASRFWRHAGVLQLILSGLCDL